MNRMNRPKCLVALAFLVVASGVPTAPAWGATEPGVYSRATPSGRTFRLHVPARYSGAALPLVVALHAGGSSGSRFAETTSFDAVSDEKNFIVVYPDGTDGSWNAGDCCTPASSGNVDDVGFIAAVIAQVKGEVNVDATRVYATGFSNGAGLALRLACERPELFAAIAPVSGRIGVPSCTVRAPVAILYVQGLDDDHNPWAGGIYDGRMRVPVSTLIGTLAVGNLCGLTDQTLASPEGKASCWARSACLGAALTFCGIDDTGHQWPGGRSVPGLGPNNGGYNATARVWDFLSSYGRPN